MFIYILLPMITIIIGGLLALIYESSSAFYSIILHFSAGVVFSVISVELLPHIIKIHDAGRIISGFTGGFIFLMGFIYLINKLKQKEKEKNVKGLSLGLILGSGIDIALDGFLLGIGFSAGKQEGVLLSCAMAVENLTLSIATATTLKTANISFKKSAGIVTGLGAVFFITGLTGEYLFEKVSNNTMEIIMSFAIAALLFLVAEELLVKAHEQKDNIWRTAPFFIGFLLFLILGLVT